MSLKSDFFLVDRLPYNFWFEPLEDDEELVAQRAKLAYEKEEKERRLRESPEQRKMRIKRFQQAYDADYQRRKKNEELRRERAERERLEAFENMKNSLRQSFKRHSEVQKGDEGNEEINYVGEENAEEANLGLFGKAIQLFNPLLQWFQQFFATADQ